MGMTKISTGNFGLLTGENAQVKTLKVATQTGSSDLGAVPNISTWLKVTVVTVGVDMDVVDKLTMLKALYPRIKNFGVHDNGSGWVRLCSGAPDLFLTNDMLLYTIEQLLKKVKAHDDKFSG